MTVQITYDRENTIAYDMGRKIAQKGLHRIYADKSTAMEMGWLEGRIEVLERALEAHIGEDLFDANFATRD